MTPKNAEVLLERVVQFFVFAERSCEVFGIAEIGCDVALGAEFMAVGNEVGSVKC